MYPRSARFDLVVASNPQAFAARVDILYNRQTILRGVNFTDGEVKLDRTRAVMGRLNLTLAEPTRLPTISDAGPMSPNGYEIQPWRGVKYSDGTEELIPQGVYPIQETDIDGDTLRADIVASDRSQLVMDARLESVYTIAAGSNYGTAIQELIASRVSGLTYAYVSTTQTTPQIVLEAQADAWKEARAMAAAVGCELFFNKDGWNVLRPEPGSTTTEPVWTLSEGAGGLLTAARLNMSRALTYNRAIVRGEHPSNPDVYLGIATDDDPASPTYYYGSFGKKPIFETTSYITSNEQASVAAVARLARTTGRSRGLQVTGITQPALDPGDVVSIVHSGLHVAENHIADAFTVPLTAKGLMGVGR